MMIGFGTAIDAIVGGYMQFQRASDADITSGLYQVFVGFVLIYVTHSLITSGIY